MSAKFSVSLITDAKRIARGLHWQAAEESLRLVDSGLGPSGTTKKRRVLILAGESPEEEIICVRTVLGEKTYILAVDRNKTCAVEASDAFHRIGHKNFDVLNGDLEQVKAIRTINKALFDVVCLDLCSTFNSSTKNLIALYSGEKLLSPTGVFIFTFSYGRDDAGQSDRTAFEMAQDLGNDHELIRTVPSKIYGRLGNLLSTEALLSRLRSVITYRGGGGYPMCSALFTPATCKLSYRRVSDEDFEKVVLQDPTSSQIYACSKERAAFLRLSAIAKKAVATRRRNNKR